MRFSVALLPLVVGCGRVSFSIVADDASVLIDGIDITTGGGNCITDISAKSRITCVARTDGTVWCFGYNLHGQLGDGSIQDSPVPVRAGSLMNVTKVVNGSVGSYALDGSGAVWGWGSNRRYQLGDGTTTDTPTPKQIFTGASQIAAGESHACALAFNNSVWCWGWNADGQIGNGSLNDAPSPVMVATGVAKVVAAGRRTCAIQTDLSVLCWGDNTNGEAGDGSAQNRKTTPTVIPGFTAVELTAGGHHTCARRGDGSVWCWGRNDHYQLGDGTTTARRTPQQVTALSSVIALHPTGGRRTCARISTGENWCWGEAFHGALGPGLPSAGMLAPTPIESLEGATMIVTASAHTCARFSDGSLACAGRNDVGQLGDGSIVDRGAFGLTQLTCP